MADEGQLLDAVLAGHHDAFADLIQPHLNGWLKMATGILGNADDADDAVQNALIQCYLHLGRFRRQARFSTWATRIVIRECQQIMRTNRRLNAQPAVSASVPAEQDPTSWDDLQAVLALVDELPSKERQLARWALIEGQQAGHIAETEGTSASVIRTRIWRLRKRLRDLWLSSQEGSHGPES